MKFFFLVIFSCLFQVLFSQQQIRTTIIEGKEHFVYPYKFSKSNYAYDGSYVGTSSDSENEIVPYPGDLPDGNYVIYFPVKSHYDKKMWFFHRRGEYVYDSTAIAALFTLKGNKVEGPARYFSGYSGNLIEEGNYKNDQKEGLWKKYAYERITEGDLTSERIYKARRGTHFSNSRYDSIVEEFNYVEGIRQGAFKKYLMHNPSVLLKTGAFTDNQLSGEWKTYYGNQKIKESYTYADSISMLNNFSKINIYDSYEYGFRVKYLVPQLSGSFHGWANEYYSNGQLLKRSWYQYGYTRGLDTTYYNDGKIRNYFTIESIKEDTSTAEIINYYRLDTLGKIILHEQRINGFTSFRFKYFLGAPVEKQYLIPYYADLKNRDTLVPAMIEYSYDDYSDTTTRKIKTISYYHLETGLVLKKKVEDATDLYGYEDFKFTQDKASNIYYLEEIDYRGKNNEFEYRSYKHYYKSPYFAYLDKYSYLQDSTKMFVNGQPFSGKLIERKGYYKRRKMEKVSVKKNSVKYYTRSYGGYDYGGMPSFGYNSRFALYQPRRRNFRRFFHGKTQTSDYSNYVDGFLEGEMKTVSGKHGKLLDDYHYTRGKKNGIQSEYSIQKADRWSDCKEIIDPEISRKIRLIRNFRYYLNTKENYINGLEEGTFYNYYCNGRISEKSEYKEGLRNGVMEAYNEEGMIRKKTNFVDNFYDGEYKEWGYGKSLRYDLTFEEGTLVGEYKYYYTNGQLQYYGNLNNGYKTGEWITYFENGVKKYVETYELQDSSYFRFNTGSYSYSYSKAPERFEHIKSTFFSKQYYPSGALAVEGKVERGNRAGVWKFYDEGENLIKQINYEPGFILQNKANGKTDSIPHFGYYESWYRNGKKQSEAYVLNESSKYDCYQQTQVSNQDLYYLNFWNQKEEQILTDKTGRIETYHLTTGKPESEGEMVNGLQQGYWRYWDPEGKLTKVGNYKNGKETGVWLMGDLEGMHYLDDACFDMNDKRAMEEMEHKKKRLKIHIIHYKKGKIIKQNSFDVNLNKTNINYYNLDD